MESSNDYEMEMLRIHKQNPNLEMERKREHFPMWMEIECVLSACDFCVW